MEDTVSKSCYNCNSKILVSTESNFIKWYNNEFCSPQCLDYYTSCDKQLGICSMCQIEVPESEKIKFCIQFGFDREQFCSLSCLSSFKEQYSFCKLCQERIKTIMLICDNSKFCSPFCVSRYGGRGVNQKYFSNINSCHICSVLGVHHLELLKQHTSIFFCSKDCINKYKKEVEPVKYICSLCGCLLVSPSMQFSRFGKLHYFCSRQCCNILVLISNVLTKCHSCEVRKYSSDLIKIVGLGEEESLNFCSIPCLRKSTIELFQPPENQMPSINSLLYRTNSDSSSTLAADLESPESPKEDKGVETLDISSDVNNTENKISDVSIVALISKLMPEKAAKGCEANPDTCSISTQVNENCISSCHSCVQTDEDLYGMDLGVELVPMPFPVYVPTPFVKFSQFHPIPMMIPMPFPIPIPIPVTKKNDKTEEENVEKSSLDEALNEERSEKEEESL